MKFAQWLESQNDIQFSFSSDGTVVAYINGRRYVYLIDAGLGRTWQQRIDYIRSSKPKAYQATCFDILNKIKELIKVGRAKQEEPQPKPVAMQQKTLF